MHKFTFKFDTTYIREFFSDVVFMITVLYSPTEAIAMTIGAGNAENTETRIKN